MRPARLVLLAWLATAGVACADTVRLFSYDPADAETRAAAGPLTFEFRQGLTRTTLLSVRSTEAEASADLRTARETALGGRGLAGLIGAEADGRALYAVETTREGGALTAALCPGSDHAWLALARPKYGRDLKVFVLGDQPKAPAARVCRTLDFSFHGEWRLPSTARKFDPNLFPKGEGPRF